MVLRNRVHLVMVKADYNVLTIKMNHGEVSHPPGCPQYYYHSHTRMMNQSIEIEAIEDISPQCSPSPIKKQKRPHCLFSADLTPIYAPPLEYYDCSVWIDIDFHRDNIHPIETYYSIAFYTSRVLFISYVFSPSHVRSYTELKQTYILTIGAFNTISPIFTHLN